MILVLLTVIAMRSALATSELVKTSNPPLISIVDAKSASGLLYGRRHREVRVSEFTADGRNEADQVLSPSVTVYRPMTEIGMQPRPLDYLEPLQETLVTWIKKIWGTNNLDRYRELIVDAVDARFTIDSLTIGNDVFTYLEDHRTRIVRLIQDIEKPASIAQYLAEAMDRTWFDLQQSSGADGQIKHFRESGGEVLASPRPFFEKTRKSAAALEWDKVVHVTRRANAAGDQDIFKGSITGLARGTDDVGQAPAPAVRSFHDSAFSNRHLDVKEHNRAADVHPSPGMP